MHNCHSMQRPLQSAMTTAMWSLAIILAVSSVRFFLVPPPVLLPAEILALSRHHFLLLLHIAGGIVAISIGPFQFVSALRDARPALHRAMGYAYLTAVLLAGCVGLLLSSDTAIFAADGLNELTAIDLSFIGLSPALLGYSASSKFSPTQFFLVEVGFTVLAIVWLTTTALAFVRARQRHFNDHRAWMIRSYSLSFAAATVRLVGLPILILTRHPVVAVTCTFWSWVLNLMVAESIIFRSSKSMAPRMA